MKPNQQMQMNEPDPQSHGFSVRKILLIDVRCCWTWFLENNYVNGRCSSQFCPSGVTDFLSFAKMSIWKRRKKTERTPVFGYFGWFSTANTYLK